jgi:hypothetical protein
LRFGYRRTKGPLVRGAVGQDRLKDQVEVPNDGQTRFGAGEQYDQNARAGYALMPQNLHASNKVSEHNIFNGPAIIVVAQLPSQKRLTPKASLKSFRIKLPGGL